jgi:hypothetical protein
VQWSYSSRPEPSRWRHRHRSEWAASPILSDRPTLRQSPAPVLEWADHEDANSNALSDPVIGHTLLFPHSARQPYDMPAFSAIPPTVDTTDGQWDEMVYPAGAAGVGLIGEVSTVAQIVSSMMSAAHRLLAAS